MKNILIVLVLIGIAAIILFLKKPEDLNQAPVAVTSFAECADAGYPVMESYPRQCRDGAGTLFVEEIGNVLEKSDLIRVSNIQPDQVVASPLVLEGEARGNWYFEASFPVLLEDANGANVPLDPPYITANGEWMTTEFVPFVATLTFTPPATDRGTLILKKDNASGLPEHDDELRIPVRFR